MAAPVGTSPRPCSGDLYCVLRATVITMLSEQMQHSFGTVRSPTREKGMAVVVQRTTTMSSNKTAISHGVLNLLLSARKIPSFFQSLSRLEHHAAAGKVRGKGNHAVFSRFHARPFTRANTVGPASGISNCNRPRRKRRSAVTGGLPG